MVEKDFANVHIPKTPRKRVLRASWDKTMKVCEELLQTFSKRQLAEAGGYILRNLESGKHGDRVGAIMAVYRFQVNEVCIMAIQTESFRRLFRQDQELLMGGLGVETSPEDHRKIQELLRQLQRDEIQAAQKRTKHCGKSASRRKRDSEKAARRQRDRAHTMLTKGGSKAAHERLKAGVR